jgi:hypothetical protein
MHTTNRNDAADLLDQVRAFVARFWAAPSEAALDALVLWGASTHATIDETLVFGTHPRILFGAKTKAAGKSTALHLTSLISARSELLSDPSGPALINLLKQERPTLLIDEIDTKMGNGTGSKVFLNIIVDGYKCRGTIVRGRNHGVERISAFAPMALAGKWQNWISNPALDPARSRTIVVPCKARRHDQAVEVYRERLHDGHAASLRAALAHWGESHAAQLGECWPTPPTGVEDRDAELWEPLLAVGTVVGGHWRERAYNACRVLSQGFPDDDEQAPSTPLDVLRRDLPHVFAGRDRMASREVVQALVDLPGSYWGRLPRCEDGTVEPVAAGREVASILAPWGVAPRVVKIDGVAWRGYDYADLEQHCGPRAQPDVDELADVPW